MNGLRVVLVTRRYWPLVGSSERVIADLAHALKPHGFIPSVVTARFDASWPERVDCRETVVHRVIAPLRFGGTTRRYLVGLAKWFREHQSDIDVVCVSRFQEDASAVLRALRDTEIPVILRAEDVDAVEIESLAQSGRRGQLGLEAYQDAAAVVVSDRVTEQHLRGAGFDPDNLHYIPNGVRVSGKRTDSLQKASRAALFNINHDLLALPGVKVAVYVGGFDDSAAFSNLLRAWRRVTDEWPQSRLWLIGDGPLRDKLFEQIRYADLHGRVLLPGTFDDPDEIFRAADVFVQPEECTNVPFFLLEAMAAGLPVVACGATPQRGPVRDGHTGRVVVGRNPAAMAQGIVEAFRGTARTRMMVQNATQLVLDVHSLDNMAAEHCRLFQDLAAKRLEHH
jgi:glycosyltransferase involved in cell wall biosynthesis